MSQQTIPWSRIERAKAIILDTMQMLHGDDEEAKNKHMRELLADPTNNNLDGRQALRELLEGKQ